MARNNHAFPRLRAVLLVVALAATALSCGVEQEPAEPAVDETSQLVATPSPTVATTPTPVVEVRAETESEPIPFDVVEQDDPDMDKGTSAVIVEGVEGTRTLTYDVELTDGVETDRTLVNDEVTTEPVDEVVASGTYEPPPEPEPEPDCDPNYADACVPIDNDVDCAGGSGDGPSYVDGPVRVVGTDIYGLDHDGDGFGCES